MATRKEGLVEMLQTVYSMLALLFILVACVELGDAATVVDVYRLIQYDLAGVPFGSRLAGLNHHAASLPFAPGTDLSRTVVIIPIREVNITFLKEYITNKKPLGGLLLLLPPDSSDGSTEDAKEGDGVPVFGLFRNVLAELEQLLVHATVPYPVYFAFEDPSLHAVLADVKKNDALGQPATATTGGYKLVVSSPEPKKIASPTITNIQGWLPGLKGEGDTNQLPTIAIVASYDTFGAAPALSVGSDSNGSGVATLLEIARLFTRLYSNPNTRGRFNLLFALTSGGPYNYDGMLKWLRSFDQRLRESIDYAICLNSVGSWGDDLWLHVSKPPENVYIKQVYESLSSVAEELGVRINIKHKKINISNPRVAWEHEQFSRLRITAATLSELSSAPELLENAGGLADSRRFVNETAVVRSAKLVAESLARHIYGQQGKNIQIFADGSSLAVNPSYIRLWLDLLSRTPRVAPFLSKNDPFVSALRKGDMYHGFAFAFQVPSIGQETGWLASLCSRELAEHTIDVNVQHEVLDGMFSFYDLTRAKLNIYQVASVTFDLLLLLVLGSYLILLFSFLVITTRGLDDLISIFRRPPSRKVKTA